MIPNVEINSNKTKIILIVMTKVVCPKFRHPVQSSENLPVSFLHRKHYFAKIVNGLLVLNPNPNSDFIIIAPR